MEQFNKAIKVGTEDKDFFFKKMTNIEGTKYFITTIDEKKKPISFSMKRSKDGEWALTPGSLRWLYDIKNELSTAIKDMQPVN